MGIQIGAKPDSGFDDPIGMLVDCHRRIERFLRILSLVVGRARGRSLTDEEREGVEAALHYFRLGGRRHTADEEESLFPRLRTSSTGLDFRDLNRLESAHQRANELHLAVEVHYQTWIGKGRLSAEAEGKLLTATEQLVQLYEEHIRMEERVVFPHAAGVLDGLDLAAMGKEFRRRRE